MVVGLRFSPNRDRLIAGIGQDLIRVWKTNDWSFSDTRADDSSGIRDVAFTPDGRVLVARLKSNELVLTGQSAHNVKHRLVRSPYAGPPFYFSGDGRRAVSMRRDGRVHIWDTSTGKEMTRFDGGNGARSGVTLNHSGSRAGIAGNDGVYRIYDVKTGQEVGSQGGGHSGYLAHALSPDGWQVISTHQEGHIQGVQVAKALDMEPDRITPPAIYGLAVGPRGQWIVSVTMKGKIRLYHRTSGRVAKAFQTSIKAARDALAFSPDGRYLAWADTQNRIRLWDLKAMRSRGCSRVINPM